MANSSKLYKLIRNIRGKTFFFILFSMVYLIFPNVPTFSVLVECFVAGTQILMGDGKYKPIEDIREGEIIKTLNLETYEIENKEVTLVLSQYHTGEGDDFTIKISFSDGTLNQNTNTHPYYVVGKGLVSYVPALTKKHYNLDVAQLEISDVVYKYINGELVKITIRNIEEIREGVLACEVLFWFLSYLGLSKKRFEITSGFSNRDGWMW